MIKQRKMQQLKLHCKIMIRNRLPRGDCATKTQIPRKRKKKKKSGISKASEGAQYKIEFLKFQLNPMLLLGDDPTLSLEITQVSPAISKDIIKFYKNNYNKMIRYRKIYLTVTHMI